MPTDLDRLAPIDDDGRLRAVLETPQGSRHKLKYLAEDQTFEVSITLPAGMSMPFDFGFFPGTKAADGDPLDVLVLMDGPAYPGVVVAVRLLGVIEAEQSDDGGEAYRNDRLIAVAHGSTERGNLRRLSDLDDTLADPDRDLLRDLRSPDRQVVPPDRSTRRAGCQTPPGRGAHQLVIRRPLASSGLAPSRTGAEDDGDPARDIGHPPAMARPAANSRRSRAGDRLQALHRRRSLGRHDHDAGLSTVVAVEPVAVR